MSAKQERIENDGTINLVGQTSQVNNQSQQDTNGSNSNLSNRQIKMRNIGKKLLGNKKAGKLFRLGLQQITASQPDYFLVVSKKFISQGQYSKAFNLLRKQINRNNIELEYKPIIMHHFMHTCYKLMNKLIKNKSKEQQQQEVKESDPFSIMPQLQSAKKKSTLTRLQKLREIMELQFENLSIYQDVLCEIIENYQSSFNGQNKQQSQAQPLEEMQKKKSFNSNFDNQEKGSISDQNSFDAKRSNLTENSDESDLIKKADPAKKIFDVYKIEVFKENYLQYFLKTIILSYKFQDLNFKFDVDQQAEYNQYNLLIFRTQFQINKIKDIINKKIRVNQHFVLLKRVITLYQILLIHYLVISGDIIQIKANIRYEQQDISEALRLYNKAYNYYRMAGQILLKKFHSKPQEEVDSVLELKCERVFSSLSINVMMQAFCYEQQLKYERMIESLSISNWINLKLLVYEFSDKLRNHVSECLLEAQQKYSTFLEEKGEIRRVLKQAFPDLEALEKKESEEDQSHQMIDHINNYLYNKGNIKEINQNLFIIQKKDKSLLHKQLQVEVQNGDHMISQDNFDLIPQQSGYDQFGSGNNTSQRNLTSNIIVSSPERVKEIGSQSFTDFYNLNNHNISGSLSTANQTSTFGNTPNTNTQFSFQNGYIKQTPSNTHASLVSPNALSNHSLFHAGTPKGHSGQHSKAGYSLHQINENQKSDYGLQVKRSSHIASPSGGSQYNYQSNRTSSQSQNNRSDKYNNNSNYKRHSLGNLVIRSNRPTHEQPAPLYMKEHNESFKPKVLTTNKYFQPETYKSITSKTLTDFREIANACQEQEKKFHYLNLEPIRQKNERNQGVISLDYAMENLIKEKIIQSEIKSMQSILKSPHHVQSYSQTGVNNSPHSAKMSNNQPQLFMSSRVSTHENQSKNNQLTGRQNSIASAQVNQNYYSEPQTNLEAQDKDVFCDKTVGVQIRNLMMGLNISQEDQKVIIDDLSAKFEAEKKSLFSHSKTNKSKVSQQGWTTDKILQELLKSINILGENVNTYNQRFSQFLSTIKDEDFDRSEFNTCLKKLQFRQRMGNGNIPQFFQEKEKPLARIQERRKIDDEYVVIQGGGERMLEIMSDQQIIKNLFFDESNNAESQQNKANQFQKDSQQAKEGILVNSLQEPNVKTGKQNQVHYSTAISMIQNEKRSSTTLDNKTFDENQTENNNKPTYKQKKRKIISGKTSTLQDIPSFQTSNSNVEKLNTIGSGQAKKIDYFQKSQESLRQMVLKSEQDYEEMQKIIQNPKKNHSNHHSQTSLVFTNFQHKLAFSTSKYAQKEKIKKAGSKLDLIDFMRIQNKWRQKVNEKHGTIISTGTMDGSENSPNSTLNNKFKKASRNLILGNSIANQSSLFSRNQQQQQE